jgi:hypothetical protein
MRHCSVAESTLERFSVIIRTNTEQIVETRSG